MAASSSTARKMAFVVIASLCVIAAVLYTFSAARKANSDQPPAPSPSGLASGDTGGQSQVDVRGPALPPPDHPVAQSHDGAPAVVQAAKPRLIAINWRDSVERGSVEVANLDAIDRRRSEPSLRCERIDVAASGDGICLRREINLLSAQTVATLVDEHFQSRFTVRLDGIPTRARMSPDGRYAAFTVFVTGHSYGDAQLSTATLLLDVKTGATVANLEQFKVLRDGNTMEAPDFNYWGVTFQRDSNFFYATLRTDGVNYLVRGDVKDRTATVLYRGVECPSLSPDESRIAFKKLTSPNNWRLTVLNLTTFVETPLAESRSVDDQAEWLDNDHVLYALLDPSPWMSIMVVAADGTGQPSVFAQGAASPSVVRQ